MAAFDTRAQPCDAGYGGTDGFPWMATPSGVKYFGRHSAPSGPTSRPSTWRMMWNTPTGVVAIRVVPPSVNAFPLPVDVLYAHTVAPFCTRNSTWRPLSISTSVPEL